jgi:hypothetical protein
MTEFQVNVAVVDGRDPRNWMIFGQSALGDVVDRMGPISAVAMGYLKSKKINVDVLLDDVETLKGGQCKSVSGIVVDGDLLLQYPLDGMNPCLARLEHVLEIMSTDEDALFRRFGLRIWIIGTNTRTYRSRYKTILEKITRILELKPSEIKVTFVKSVQVVSAELGDLAEELALFDDFVFLEGS